MWRTALRPVQSHPCRRLRLRKLIGLPFFFGRRPGSVDKLRSIVIVIKRFPACLHNVITPRERTALFGENNIAWMKWNALHSSQPNGRTKYKMQEEEEKKEKKENRLCPHSEDVYIRSLSDIFTWPITKHMYLKNNNLTSIKLGYNDYNDAGANESPAREPTTEF